MPAKMYIVLPMNLIAALYSPIMGGMNTLSNICSKGVGKAYRCSECCNDCFCPIDGVAVLALLGG